MRENTGSGILGPMLIAVVATVILAAIVVYLGRSKKVTSRPLLGLLAVVSLAPLFGGALYLAVKHEVWRVEDKTTSGDNGVHPEGEAHERAN